MIRKYFLLLFLQFFAFYYRSSNTNPLIGAAIQSATDGEFPFIVSLCRNRATLKRSHQLCGGSLITRKHVLTAAHCFDNHHHHDVIVVVGHTEIELGQTYEILSFIEYDDWAERNNVVGEYDDNDIGIVTLIGHVEGIESGRISGLTYNQVVKTRNVVTAGWGFTNETNGNVSPLSLQKAYLRVLSHKKFERIVENWPLSKLIDAEPNKYFTTSNPPVILGCGDSGGPLMLTSNHEIVGVNDSSCNIDDPQSIRNATSFHVVVDYYRDFIANVTNLTRSCNSNVR